MIKIIAVGSIKEKYLKEGIEDYLQRIKKYTNIEIVEIKDEGILSIEQALLKEEERILKAISTKDYIITLEIDKAQYSSEDFARKIDKIFISHSNVTFIIGGSYGLSNTIKHLANESISFSKMTFPHQLFRMLLLEQIYRSYKINNNESYHK